MAFILKYTLHTYKLSYYVHKFLVKTLLKALVFLSRSVNLN